MVDVQAVELPSHEEQKEEAGPQETAGTVISIFGLLSALCESCHLFAGNLHEHSSQGLPVSFFCGAGHQEEDGTEEANRKQQSQVPPLFG